MLETNLPQYDTEKSLREVDHDPIAVTAREAIEALRTGEKPGEFFTIEVLQGEVRSDPDAPSQQLFITCKDLATARTLREKITNKNVVFIQAHPHNLPFGHHEKIGAVVDPHEASHVGHDEDSLRANRMADKVSPTLGKAKYLSVRQSLVNFAREVGVLSGLANVTRPEYITAKDHEQMKLVLIETLRNRAKLLGENGVLIASFAAARENLPAEQETYAVHAMEGEIVLTQVEMRQVMADAGLEVERMEPGMAPKNQLVAAESAAKVLLFTALGGEEFKQKMIATYIPAAHRLLSQLDKILPAKKENDPAGKPKASGIGARMTGKPDRYVVVARKKPTN